MTGITLSGLDGSNPLAFLAALGAFRLLASRLASVRLHWRIDGNWQPVLSGFPDGFQNSICRMILDSPAVPAPDISLALGKNLTVSATIYEAFAQSTSTDLQQGKRLLADFVSAFGSEACTQEKKDRIQYTSFCFITGSGHQDFIETAATLLRDVKEDHIREALFGPWRYEKGLSMRWDPADAREYALRWNDPGPEGVKAVWGANRLAMEALPLFPVYPNGKELLTTGFRKSKPWDEFTWPVWTMPVSCDTVRSLVALQQLQEPIPDRTELTVMGIAEVFRVHRVRIGMGANFKVGFRPARAV